MKRLSICQPRKPDSYCVFASEYFKEHGGGLLFHNEPSLLLQLVEQSPGGLIVEIGAWRGGTSYMIGAYLTQMNLSKIVLSIDIKLALRQNEHINNGRNVFLQLDSKTAARTLWMKPGLIYVDGCHCFDCVTSDIDLWWPKLLPGGFMVFHDVTKDGREQFGTPHQPQEVGRALKDHPIISAMEPMGSAFNGHMLAYQKT